MVQIIIKEASNRLIYTLSVVFETIFKIPYQAIPLQEVTHIVDAFALNYTDTFVEGTLQIPNKGLLTSANKNTPFLIDISLPFRENWYISPKPFTNSLCFSYDILSAIFYLLSDYEKYQLSAFDTHKRYDETAYPSFQMQTNKEPLVHLLCEELLSFFPQNLQKIIQEKRKYDYEITFDIDNPWKHQYKSAIIQLAGFLKDLLLRNKENLSERCNIIKGRKDVNDTFDQIFPLCSPEKTRFFCLIDRHSPYDTRFTYQHQALRSLIQKLYQEGYSIGIHPSYTSFESEEKIAFETKQLSYIINVPIRSSRQHFLRYRLPHTFRYLIQAGITDDYTLCLYHDTGFPCGMAVPFKWYDLEKEAITNLTLHPTLAMDRALQQYRQCSPDQALAKIEDLVQTVKRIGGKMTMVFHNESLSESGDWKGWSSAIKQMIESIKG